MANKHIKRCSTSLRQYISVVLSHLVCGNLFHQPHEVKMHTFVFCPVMSSTLWNRPLCMISLQNSYKLCHQFSSVQSSHSVVSNSVTPWTAARQASMSITNSQSLFKLLSIELVMPLTLLLVQITKTVPTAAAAAKSLQSCPTLCNPMNCSTPGLPVHHQLLEITQTHVHRVSDAIQPSHPLSSHFPPAPSSSQHQSVFR